MVTMETPSAFFHVKSDGTSGGVLAEFTPMCKNLTPASASGPTSPIVCPGTSVIFAPAVVRPNRESSDFENPRQPVIMDLSINSVCQLNGRACHAISPAAIAASIFLRPSADACSRYSYSSHDPVVHVYRSVPDSRIWAA